MNYWKQKNDFSLAKEFQKHPSKEHLKHGVVDQGKYRKWESKRKSTDREYHVQDNADVSHKDVKMYCDTKQLPALPFFVPHPKPHVERWWIKHYNLRFDPRLGHGICAIIRIPCACVECTSMLYKTWIYCIPSKKQANYQPITNCTYWTVMGSYKKLE